MVKDKVSLLKYVVAAVVGLYVLHLLLIGLSSACLKPDRYLPEPLPAGASDQDRARVLSVAVTQALENELNFIFGFLPNDLNFVPSIIDNRSEFQRGVVYATRQASDIIAKDVSRYGDRDTIDARLADATARFFAYSENVWGFWFVYDCEGKYRQGIANWKSWAESVGTAAKNAGIYNMRSDDIYNILRYCMNMTDYALGMLNNDQLGHFGIDNAIYYTKGVALVTGNVLAALSAVDSSVKERGGSENLVEAMRRFDMINAFDPLLTIAGGSLTGDAMLPNHVAALARHFDIANNRIADMMHSMEK